MPAPRLSDALIFCTVPTPTPTGWSEEVALADMPGLDAIVCGSVAWWRDARRGVSMVTASQSVTRAGRVGADRMLMIAVGYEDGNDANTLRGDPMFKLALDRLPSGEELSSPNEQALPWARKTGHIRSVHHSNGEIHELVAKPIPDPWGISKPRTNNCASRLPG